MWPELKICALRNQPCEGLLVAGRGCTLHLDKKTKKRTKDHSQLDGSIKILYLQKSKPLEPEEEHTRHFKCLLVVVLHIRFKFCAFRNLNHEEEHTAHAQVPSGSWGVSDVRSDALPVPIGQKPWQRA